jgi:hypothetical protein
VHRSLASFPSRRLLLIAATLHISLSLIITVVGKSKIVPNTFDTNGVGISFALDSASYRSEALQMAYLLRELRLRDWWNYTGPLATFHSRIYSISYALLGPVFGEGILAIEPVNLFYYLSTLVLTYLIGAAVFSEAVGRLAAAAVGLWPSLLIFSTQLLRDPLFISAFLLLLVSLVFCIKRPITLKQAFGYASMASAALVIVLLGRATMWEILGLVVLLAALFCAASQIIERRFDPPKTIAILLVCVVAILLPKLIPSHLVTDRANRGLEMQSSISGEARWTRVARQIGWTRHRFIAAYPTAGSNVDSDVELHTVSDIVKYFPRALQIGLLAPFPQMWFSAGKKVGLTGRLLIGAEMLTLYLVLGLSAVTVILRRRNLLVWLLFGVAVLGCVALAYVVVNASALYRLRYPYFILFILLAAQGLSLIKRKGISQPTSQTRVDEVAG